MHPEFQKLKKTWWWIKSPEAYRRFTSNPFAQGYEVLRRIEKFRNQLPHSFCAPHETWEKLYQRNREYFSVNFKNTLIRLNLLKTIFAGPKGISFDANLSNDHLLKALESELIQPTLVACGVDPMGDSSFRAVAKFTSHPNRDRPYRKREDKLPWVWNKGLAGVYLQIPQNIVEGKSCEPSSEEIFAYFRNFIKHDSPADFAAYRKEIRKQTIPARQENARTLAMGLMAHDYAYFAGSELKELAVWLCKIPRIKKGIFKLDDQQLSSAVYHAKTRICKVFEAAARL